MRLFFKDKKFATLYYLVKRLAEYSLGRQGKPVDIYVLRVYVG